jgi:hypothetical protein
MIWTYGHRCTCMCPCPHIVIMEASLELLIQEKYSKNKKKKNPLKSVRRVGNNFMYQILVSWKARAYINGQGLCWNSTRKNILFLCMPYTLRFEIFCFFFVNLQVVDEEETANSFNELQKEIERQLEEKTYCRRARKHTLGMFFNFFWCFFLILG